MAKKGNTQRRNGNILFGDETNQAAGEEAVKRDETPATKSEQKNFRSDWRTGSLAYLRNPAHWWVVGLIALLSLGAFGAGLKYLEEAAQKQKAVNLTAPRNTAGNQSLLSSLNPFAEPPLPTATPQLSKEIIYAGSRMLTVEDANANVAPPADLAVWRPSNGYVVCSRRNRFTADFLSMGRIGGQTRSR